MLTMKKTLRIKLNSVPEAGVGAVVGQAAANEAVKESMTTPDTSHVLNDHQLHRQQDHKTHIHSKAPTKGAIVTGTMKTDTIGTRENHHGDHR